MSQDISHVLAGWDFDPHELNVRVISGNDGREWIQMRIDLGLIQMAVDGRPDGKRPNGYESLLDGHERLAEENSDYKLNSEAVDELFREGWQYYQRYLCCFHLGRYDAVARDTERNLRLFEFVRRHARRKRDQWRFDQYRPYVIMMHARASAMIALENANREKALAEIDEGRRLINAFLRDNPLFARAKDCFELEFLNRWYEEISGHMDSEPKPLSEIEELRASLRQAIEREDYEFAALVRDRIRRIEQPEATE